MALVDPVSLAHAAAPANDSERLLFRYLYDTLVRLDCEGRARPGLAAAWTADSAGRAWTFTLSDEARLPSGAALRPADIVSAWQARPDVLASTGIQAAMALDERRLSVTLTRRIDSMPALFADPALALAVRDPGGPQTVDFRLVAGGDPRDALDRGAGLLVTRDPMLVDYAGSRADLMAIPLPWSLTYVLLQPAGAAAVREISGNDSLLGSLARDAVRAEARPAEPPFWWNSLPACDLTHSPQVGQPAGSRVIYAAGDEVARGLAERIVALAGSGTRLKTAALNPAEFAAALRSGSERAYVVAAPRHSLAPCRDAAAWPPAASILPLIDTRARAILRQGSSGLEVEWDGTVRVVRDTGRGPERS